MTVADSEANLAVYSRQRGGPNGASGYPMLRLLALVSCGTRTVIDAVSGPVSAGETTCAPGLLASLPAGMILLADRGFGAGFLAAQIAGTRADFLIRVRASFAVALKASRDQVILAAGVFAGPATDLAGKIGGLVLASLMPSRRLRVSPRVVKRALSRYNARGNVDRTTRKAVIAIAILGAP
jgi:Transposase DDE domain